MWIAALTALLLAAPPAVEVTTLTGAQSRGPLAKLSLDAVEIQGQKPVPSAELLAVKSTTPPKAISEKPLVWIELIDGSRLVATQFTVAKTSATAKLVGGESVEVPTRSIHSVRIKDHDNDLARAAQLPKQWRELAEGKLTSDTIVIRKMITEDDGRMVTNLDQLEGVLGDVTDDKVHFTYDGQALPVDRAKVEGLLYFHPAGRELPLPLCRVDDAAGSRWNAKSVALTETSIQLTSTSGVKFDLPLERWQGLDYSAGKIVYLSDLEPENVEFTNAYGATGAGANLSKLFAPRSDRSFSGEPLAFAGKTYEKGLALHSRTLIEYRVAGKYSKFLALGAIDEKVRPAGDVKLVVSLDGKVLGEHRISGKDAQPVAIEYDITSGRKLSLLVDYGAALDIGDRLHLLNARVTK
jgi:hypothetical protein